MKHGGGAPSFTVTILGNKAPWTWSCNCGQRRGGYADERECRDDGLDHQRGIDPHEKTAAAIRAAVLATGDPYARSPAHRTEGTS